MRLTKALLAFGVLVLISAGPAAMSQGSPPRVPAKIVDFEFQPKELTVDLGAIVEWTNTGARPHTVTDRGGTFDATVQPQAKTAVAFTVPGRFLYFCRINPSKMNGVIVVKPGNAPSKVVRVQAIDPAREGETFRFDPNSLSVQAGSAIVFANVGGKPHTLTADDGSFDTGVVTPGAEGGRFAGSSATIVLGKPGNYPFHCEVHPLAMKGVVAVTGTAPATVAGAASNAPRQTSVDAVDFEFKPPQTSVAPAGDVTFQNKGSAPHTMTFDDVSLDTDRVTPGSSAKFKAPDKGGSYSYHCNVHPAKMRGVLVVVGQNAQDPTARSATGPPKAATGGGGGAGGGVSALALGTGVVGAFLGGFGISAFVRNSMGASSA